MRKTSPRGIKAISLREGTVLHGYNDSKGLLTVGVGHLVKPGEPYTLNGKITQAESDRLLAQDLHIAESAVNNAVKVPLTQNQFDALVSFVVNIGVGGFNKSQVLRGLNAGDYNGAANAMMNWVKPPEITGRRKSEQKQFLTPDPKDSAAVPPQISDTSAHPVEPTDAAAADITKVTETKANGDTVHSAEVTKLAGDSPEVPPVQVSQNGPLAKWIAGGGGLTAIGTFVWGYVQSNPSAVGIAVVCVTLLIVAIIFRGAITDAIRMQTAADPNKRNVS